MLTKGITYKELIASFKKGLRNGNWRKLRFLDKALYRAAMGYARNGRSMMNGKLVEKLLELVAGLKETKGMRIFKGGFEKAVELLGKGEENGMFAWLPSLRHWLKDLDYIYLLAGDGAVKIFVAQINDRMVPR
ncbi:hypothetical protein DRN97_07170 [Methanosarcinales archaeon]|nr:MAG: hypothetical protein DRN97_07170 [Methanosarcinales archaeon]